MGPEKEIKKINAIRNECHTRAGFAARKFRSLIHNYDKTDNWISGSNAEKLIIKLAQARRIFKHYAKELCETIEKDWPR